jgi:D-alanyl-D-alanine carboxypeptidase (penicillin-binding protein 5/6)
MMLVSGNDASVAIAEHVAGNEDTFVDLLNMRAGELGLTNTLYNQQAGGGYSTPQDQVTLNTNTWPKSRGCTSTVVLPYL